MLATISFSVIPNQDLKKHESNIVIGIYNNAVGVITFLKRSDFHTFSPN
ncbi:hypothetical protein SAMN05216490_2240 [Mucilaginibacter mallensis]|uniref:Uncharacterized protein n=1 Tax=Mucilaginibacter mallensis TaxID=652787 RepID=A0A1H1WN82_MUCMA|nr:hypothetical protein SAMN05216490_2240 [Mucilaginibacter mallensis]